MRRVANTLFCCLWVAHGAAQDPPPDKVALERAVVLARARALQEKPREVACPFEAPRLSSRDPAEVAWAAARLTVEDARKPEVTADLIAALQVHRGGATEQHHRAVLHLLHAAFQHGVVIPMAELRFQPENGARIPWIALQTRAATGDGRELFALFHTLDATTDAGWEVVGGSLALRGHGAFAIELRTQMVPRLRVFAGQRPNDASGPRSRLEPEVLLPGFPTPPAYLWERDKYGIVGAACGAVSVGNSQAASKIEAPRLDQIRLRWLAELVGERDPVTWSARFDARFAERDMGKFQAFADAAEQRARESLGTLDAELRRRFKLPERLRLPDLEVVWEDLRRPPDKAAQPMPERR